MERFMICSTLLVLCILVLCTEATFHHKLTSAKSFLDPVKQFRFQPGKYQKKRGLFSSVPTFSQGYDQSKVTHSYLKPFVVDYPIQSVPLGVKIPFKRPNNHGNNNFAGNQHGHVPSPVYGVTSNSAQAPVNLPPADCHHLHPSPSGPSEIPVLPTSANPTVALQIPTNIVPTQGFLPALPVPQPPISIIARPVFRPVVPVHSQILAPLAPAPFIPRPIFKPVIPIHTQVLAPIARPIAHVPVAPAFASAVIRPGNSVHTSFFGTFPKHPIVQSAPVLHPGFAVAEGHAPGHFGHVPLNVAHGPVNIAHGPVNVGHIPLGQFGHGPVAAHGPLNVGHIPLGQFGHGPVAAHGPLNVGHIPLGQFVHGPLTAHGPLGVGHVPLGQFGHGPLTAHGPLGVGHIPLGQFAHGPVSAHGPLEVGHIPFGHFGHGPVNVAPGPLNIGHGPLNFGHAQFPNPEHVAPNQGPVAHVPINFGHGHFNIGQVPANIPANFGNLPPNFGPVPSGPGQPPINFARPALPVNNNINPTSFPVSFGNFPVNFGNIPPNFANALTPPGETTVTFAQPTPPANNIPTNIGSFPPNFGNFPVNDGNFPVNFGNLPLSPTPTVASGQAGTENANNGGQFSFSFDQNPFFGQIPSQQLPSQENPGNQFVISGDQDQGITPTFSTTDQDQGNGFISDVNNNAAGDSGWTPMTPTPQSDVVPTQPQSDDNNSFQSENGHTDFNSFDSASGNGYHYRQNGNQAFHEVSHQQNFHRQAQQQYLNNQQQNSGDHQHEPQFPQALPEHPLSGRPVSEAFHNHIPLQQRLPLRRPLEDFNGQQ